MAASRRDPGRDGAFGARLPLTRMDERYGQRFVIGAAITVVIAAVAAGALWFVLPWWAPAEVAQRSPWLPWAVAACRHDDAQIGTVLKRIGSGTLAARPDQLRAMFVELADVPLSPYLLISLLSRRPEPQARPIIRDISLGADPDLRVDAEDGIKSCSTTMTRWSCRCWRSRPASVTHRPGAARWRTSNGPLNAQR